VNWRFTQTIDKHDIDSCKEWLCDDTPINVGQGLGDILSYNNPLYSLKQMQVEHLTRKLTGNMLSPKGSMRVNDGVLLLDDVVTLISNFNKPGILESSIKSRPQFVKLIYQHSSCFPDELYEAYAEVTGKSLRLDDFSEVREFYEECSSFNLWTAHQLCAYISHCDPEALDCMSDNPKEVLPDRLSRIFSRSDLYEKNVTLVKAAILGEAFELIHMDRDNWLKSTLRPKKGLEWAKKRRTRYHPVLDELVFALHTTPVISSGYTTPYLEMMQQVIREQEITRENQGKKESLAASFEKKLDDHKLTRPSQKLADAMATLVRLPESQQGRAKTKG
jgi:hypothetical protein